MIKLLFKLRVKALSSPGSWKGNFPDFKISILSGFTSIPYTLLPLSAKPKAVVNPTNPKPKTVIFIYKSPLV